MRNLSLRALSAGVALALTGGLAGAAQASPTNVVTAIKTQDEIITQTPGDKALRHLTVNTRAQAKKLVVELGALEKTATHAVTVVSQSSTSSARQRQGKADWIRGSEEQNRAILELITAFKEALADNQAAKAEYTKATKLLAAGSALGAKGDKLLGLPTTY
jgi:hypothetical protein